MSKKKRRNNLEIILTKRQIQKKVRELARNISKDLKGEEVVAVGVLKGAFMFMADLVRQITIPISCDFLRASSYGDSYKSSGVVRIEFDLTQNVRGKTLLLVEDIIDSGLTIKYLLDNLWAKKPKQIKICSLLCKPSRSEVKVKIDYLGFEIPDKFVVGYGLDYSEKYRSLPYIAAIPDR